jgi:hypothetical protein
MPTRSFSLRYGRFSRPLLTAFASGPGRSQVVVDDTTVDVSMGPSFRGRAPLRAVISARPCAETVVSRGVHGWRGDWLVNGAGDGLVEVGFEPPMPARVLGFPVRVHRLRVSVNDPDGLIEALVPGALV